MRCPFCSSPDTQVKDSRVSEDGYTIRRRRSCIKCGSRFTTLEHIQNRDFIVIKKNDVRVPFDRDKLFKSVLLALSKRQIESEKVDQLVNRIVKKLESLNEQEVKSSTIGELVMAELILLDKVAYVRYASVYKNFTNPTDFEDFVNRLVKKK